MSQFLYLIHKATRSSEEKTMSNIHASEASETITSILRENKVCLGGASMGKGFIRASRYYIDNYLANRPELDCLKEEGAQNLELETIENIPVEDSFYVVDIGVIISQYFQWRKVFPRVECFYAVKCNPDPVIVKTLAALGANFDCASRNEIRLVKNLTKEMSNDPEIIYANPCKARLHLIEAVCKGVTLVTFDNVTEVVKCAGVSKHIELILRIVTDDRGSQCRLSSKFGAPRRKWRPLLNAAKQYGMKVVGVSFHVGSGCRDASRYELALTDARELFDMAKKDYGFDMKILDIGGGFPGETHSTWNPTDIDSDDEEDSAEGLEKDDEAPGDHYMYFTEIASKVAPMIDDMFPIESGVRVIAEPGRYFAAAAATLVASVVACRRSETDEKLEPLHVSDKEAAENIDQMTREDEDNVVRQRSLSFVDENENVLETIADELADYGKLYARQHLAQQETDVYNDNLDLYREGYETSIDLLGPPNAQQKKESVHTVEGMDANLVNSVVDDGESSCNGGILSLPAVGEAAMNGLLLQSIVDSTGFADDFAYYLNDGVYSAFNSLMYDHAVVRPRRLKNSALAKAGNIRVKTMKDGLVHLEKPIDGVGIKPIMSNDTKLYVSTVFGPTCDSIDVISRSVLLPKLEIGDWLYFQNMGAYTMAASSCFNGFNPSERFYVCSVPPKYLGQIIAGYDPSDVFVPEITANIQEEKKE